MLTNQLHGQLQMLTHSITLTCTYVAHLTTLAIHTFTERAYCISVYNTCTLLLNNDDKYTISLFRVMNPHQRCLHAKVKYQNELKQVMPKSEAPIGY